MTCEWRIYHSNVVKVISLPFETVRFVFRNWSKPPQTLSNSKAKQLSNCYCTFSLAKYWTHFVFQVLLQRKCFMMCHAVEHAYWQHFAGAEGCFLTASLGVCVLGNFLQTPWGNACFGAMGRLGADGLFNQKNAWSMLGAGSITQGLVMFCFDFRRFWLGHFDCIRIDARVGRSVNDQWSELLKRQVLLGYIPFCPIHEVQKYHEVFLHFCATYKHHLNQDHLLLATPVGALCPGPLSQTRREGPGLGRRGAGAPGVWGSIGFHGMVLGTGEKMFFVEVFVCFSMLVPGRSRFFIVFEENEWWVKTCLFL